MTMFCKTVSADYQNIYVGCMLLDICTKIIITIMNMSNTINKDRTGGEKQTSSKRHEGSSNISSYSGSLATDSSSLVDLKAEVFRKQQEAKFNKSHSRGSLKLKNSVSEDTKREKKDKIWSKQNVGLTEREKKDLEVENERQKNIQHALEEKSKLYDKLSSGEMKHDGRFLVNFNKSDANELSSEDENNSQQYLGHDHPQNESEAWVEYKDSLGRTRMAMAKDLPDLISQDKSLKQTVHKQNDNNIVPTETNSASSKPATKEHEIEPSLLSEDMRRELLRQKWEQEEEENLKKTKIHYKDVLFDEARTHGAAFYKFSRNESERTEEMENLKDMHKETEKGMILQNLILKAQL